MKPIEITPLKNSLLMKKDKPIFLLVLLTSLLLTAACDDKDATWDAGKAYPAIITGKAFNYDATTGGATWNKGETIGVYMLESGTNRIVTPYSNIRYYANDRTDQDYFLPGNNDSILYYPPTGEAMEIAAYYPRTAVEGDSLVAINLLNQAYISVGSLLYSRVPGVGKEQRKATLNLRPALTKLTFKFSVGLGMTESDLRGLTVVLKGLPVSGFFNVTTGTFRHRDVYLDIKLTVTEQQAALGRALTRAERATEPEKKPLVIAEGVVLPSSNTNGYQAVITLPAIGKTYVYEIAKGTGDLNGSQDYTFDSQINNDDMIVKVQSSPIINWGEGGSIGGEGTENK